MNILICGKYEIAESMYLELEKKFCNHLIEILETKDSKLEKHGYLKSRKLADININYLNNNKYIIVFDNKYFIDLMNTCSNIKDLSKQNKLNFVFITEEIPKDKNLIEYYNKGFFIQNDSQEINYDRAQIFIRKILFRYKDIPSELLNDWNYSEESILSVSPDLKNHKFFKRRRCIKNNWNRLQNYFPETFKEKKLKFLDLSCGNGATLECVRFLGHETFGVDYESESHCLSNLRIIKNTNMPNKWLYKILLDSQNISYKGHDLNVLPYPFADKSFDIVNCWGAIEFYSRPKFWPLLILEMLRISNLYVNIAFNLLPKWAKTNISYVFEFNNFIANVQNIMSKYGVNAVKITNYHYKFYIKNDITLK